MTKSDTYTAFIREQLRKGNVIRERVMANFGKKWQIGDRTFDRYWKLAQQQHAAEQKAIESKKAAIISEEAVKAVKRDIIDKYERLEILSKMARGIGRKVGEEIMIPTDHDRRGAIDLINKMEGLYNDKSGTSMVVVSINQDSIELQIDEI